MHDMGGGGEDPRGDSGFSYDVVTKSDGRRLACHSTVMPVSAMLSGSPGILYDGLAPGIGYVASYYWGSGCNLMDRFATAEFATLANDAGPRPALSVENIGSGSATLRISNHAGAWWYRAHARGDGNHACVGVDAGTATADLSGLEANTTYHYSAWSDGGCGKAAKSIDWWSFRSFTTSD